MPTIQTKPFSWKYWEIVRMYNAGRRNLTKKEFRILIAVVIGCALLALSPLFLAAAFIPSERVFVFNGLLKVFKWGAIVFIGYYAFLFLLLRFRLWMDFQSNFKLYQADRTVTCSDEGIDVVSSNTNTHLDWSYIQSTTESNEFFLLFYGKNLYLAIPKKALAQTQIEDLRTALKSKHSKYKMIS